MKYYESKRKYERLKRRKITISLSLADYDRVMKSTEEDGTFRNIIHLGSKIGTKYKTKVPAPSIYVRKIVLAAINNENPLPEKLMQEFRNLRIEIRRIANNINQAVKLAHQKKDNKNIKKELEQVLRSIKHLEGTMKAFLQSSFWRRHDN